MNNAQDEIERDPRIYPEKGDTLCVKNTSHVFHILRVENDMVEYLEERGIRRKEHRGGYVPVIEWQHMAKGLLVLNRAS